MIRSAFIYGYTVEDEYKSFYFDEGGGVLTFDIPPKSYSLGQIVTTLQALLTETGTQTYSVTVNRNTRKLTISAASNFDLLPSETINNSMELLGFTSDATGANSYESDTSTGDIYKPPFFLEGYKPFGLNNIAINGKVKTAPSGVTRATDFGSYTTMTCSFLYIADQEHKSGNPIRTSLNSVQEAKDFMNFCITKSPLEFFEDETDLSSPDTCFLLKTKKDSTGLGYELSEMRNLYQIYELTNNEFRKI